MDVFFNDLLAKCGLDPHEVALVRHCKEAHDLWRRNKAKFECYVSTQPRPSRWASKFARPYWANFVAEPNSVALFTCLYRAHLDDPRKITWKSSPLDFKPISPETADLYRLEPMEALSAVRGRLRIDWGAKYCRVLAQDADVHNKLVSAASAHPHPL